MKKLFFVTGLISLIMAAQPALAQTSVPDGSSISNFTTIVPGANETPDTPLGNKYATGNYNICDFFRLLANVIKVLFEVAAGAALFLFLWTAFGMISNWGNAENAQHAFMNLKNIFYGIAIMLGAWFLVNVIIVTATGKVVPTGAPGGAKAAAVFNKPWSNLEEVCKGL